MNNENVVLINAIGGLGNQMFCYAFYRKMCMEYPMITFKMDISDIYDKRFPNNLELLTAFPRLEISQASKKEIWKNKHRLVMNYRGKGSKLLKECVDHINSKLMARKRATCITEESFVKCNYKICSEQWENISYFNGFWQKIEWYIPILETLRRDFIFAEIRDEKNKELVESISKGTSVSVHVRRGDYVGEILDILDTEYYRKIISLVKSEYKDAHFYFFSNDAHYVEREYNWLEEKTIVTNNAGCQSFRDMQLMSLCQINIIANSTFSMWAALLNQREGRRVYYPDHFMKNELMQVINMKDFVRVNVDY